MDGKRKKNPADYRERSYRTETGREGLIPCHVQLRETDLHILADREVAALALASVGHHRRLLEGYIEGCPAFLHSLTPLAIDPLAPPVAKRMLKAAAAAGVGPMAAVAGSIAELVGRDLLAQGARQVIVENGGDIFLACAGESRVAIFAGDSPLSGRVALALRPEQMPVGVCTSSATVGHSLSFGRADAVTVVAADCALADAVATRLGNLVRRPGDIEAALAQGRTIAGVTGIVIIQGKTLGGWGDVRLEQMGG
ncbi:MAG: UPF0280 family protein [Thermodesulfobacteriota bacterium]